MLDLTTVIEQKKQQAKAAIEQIENFRRSVATQDEMLLETVKDMYKKIVVPLLADLQMLKLQAAMGGD
jgi:hypothetical protein